MRVFVIIGTRPEAIKMAPVYKMLLAREGIDPILISTGQHREMLNQVFEWFELEPHEDLKVMRPDQTLNDVLTRSLAGLDGLIKQYKPNAILAQGDTTTVMASALAAYGSNTAFGHVEAGLRTYDIASPYPEEGFRQMASRVAKWHFAPTRRAAETLSQEALGGDVYLVVDSKYVQVG